MIRRLLDSLRVLLGRRDFERDMDAELRAHLDLQTDALVRLGFAEPEARRKARAAFGALEGAKDAARAARGVRWADELWGDLRYAFRTLRKSPGYAAVAIATLAVGIGANTAIFSVVDGVLLKPLPFPDSHALVHINFGYPLGSLWTYRSAPRSYSGVAAYEYAGELNLYAKGIPERIKGRPVSAEFFAVLGVTPLLGRTFQKDEDAPGAEPVAVVSEVLWRRRFGGDPNLVGQSILIDGTPRKVIGVVPKSFAFPSVGTDVWVPVLLDNKLIAQVWGAGGTTLFGRLKPGVTLEQADAEHRALIPTVRRAPPFRLPDIWGTSAENHVRFLDAEIGSRVKGRLSLLLAAVGLVLLVACVNVANLNLTRLSAREREVMVRQALGGTRARVARQLAVEQLVLAGVGGVFGVATAYAALPALIRWLPPETPRLDEVGIDLRVLGFTGLAVLAAALLSSLGALFRLPRVVGSGQLAVGKAYTAGPGRQRLLGTLVSSEVALAVVLAIGALILVRSLDRLLGIDPGFVPERIVTAQVTPNPLWCKDQAGPCTCESAGTVGATPDAARCKAFYPALAERLAALPGFRDVTMGNTVPLDGGYFTFPMDIEGLVIPQGQPAPLIGVHVVAPGYLAVLGIPLQEGRDFSAADRAETENVVVVSRALAQRFWPGQTAIGKKIKPVWMPTWRTVVGVVADVRYETLSGPPARDFYMPLTQWSVGTVTVAVKSTATAAELEPILRREVAAVDPSATVSQIRSMEDVVLASAGQQRITTSLIALFAVMALLLGAIGVYGVLSYGVTQRRREIGIRMAIGADAGSVKAMVLRQAGGLLLGGVVAGLVIAWLAASVLQGFVFGVSVRDPLTYVLVPLLFGAVGMVAGWLPARRATRVSPTEVMREE